MPALVKAEPTRAPRNLCNLPRQQVAPLLAVELRRLRKEQRLAGQVDAVAEHVRRRAHLRGARKEPVDLLAPRRKRHGSVQHGDLARMQQVQLAREPDHGATAERDDDSPRPKPNDPAPADPVERRLALEEPHVDLRERMPDERQRLDRSEQQDVAIIAAEHQPRPRRPALVVLRPLHLVEHQRLAAHRRHLRGAADDRRLRVDALLPRHEADVVPEISRQAPVRLLREHAQGCCVDAAAAFDQELQRVVGLPGVRRPEVRDDRLRLTRTLGQPDGQVRDGLAHRLAAAVPFAPTRTFLAPVRHGASR